MDARTLCTVAAALWWSSLGVVGFVVVPLLFTHLPSPSMAGFMAAKLFAAQTWVSTAAAVLILLLSRPRREAATAPWAVQALPWVIAGLLLALLLQYGVAPRILARQDLRLWHSLGSAFYALQWLCASLVFWRLLRHGQHPSPAARSGAGSEG